MRRERRLLPRGRPPPAKAETQADLAANSGREIPTLHLRLNTGGCCCLLETDNGTGAGDAGAV